MIQLKKIVKSYGISDACTTVLKDISLNINEGEMVAITGKSGSGKSTLLHILGTLDKPCSGEYWFSDTNITHISGKQLANFRNQYLGFVFQSYFLLSHKNALENVMLPFLYREHSDLDNTENQAKEMLKKVEMEDRFYHKPSELSGGQCQRVAIARALVNQPSVILADEPTGALDSATSANILSLFCQLNKEGQTIIMVTHDEQIANICNRRIQITDGRIIQE